MSRRLYEVMMALYEQRQPADFITLCDELERYNVCGKGKVKQPRPVKYEAHPLAKEQAKQLLDVAKGGPLEGLITLAVAIGMRRGELLGLRWHDINFQEGSLQVRHTMDRAGKYGIIEGDPRTEKSKRKIFLPQFVLDALKIQRIRQGEMREAAGASWQERDIVFSNDGGGFIEPTDLGRKFKRLLKDASLPDMRFHDLRHSAATILLGMGANPKLVQELLQYSTSPRSLKRRSRDASSFWPTVVTARTLSAVMNLIKLWLF